MLALPSADRNQSAGDLLPVREIILLYAQDVFVREEEIYFRVI